MGGFTTGDGQSPETIMFADSCCFDGTQRTTVMNQDGQLWIGSSVSPFVRPSNLTSLDGSIDISNGQGTIDLSSTGSDLHVARFIVAASGTVGTGANFTTINAAVASAAGTGVNCMIFIQPGTYVENITLPAGISLTAFNGDGAIGDVIIQGKITCNASNANNQNSICGLYLATNGDYCIEMTGANICLVKVIQCFLACSNSNAIHITNANASLMLKECTGNTAVNTSIFTVTNTSLTSLNGGLIFIDCFFDNNLSASTTASTISNGQCQLYNSRFLTPITTSGTANFSMVNSIIDCGGINTTALTIGGSGGNDILDSYLTSGTATALVMTASGFVQNVVVKSTNAAAISGAGTINYSGINFRDTSSAMTTTTQVPKPVSNDAIVIKTPGAYPYTTVPQDGLILVDSSVARTITPLASPTTGQRHIIKDSVGSAAANNITVTPSGKNIDGAASSVINVNYGSVTIIYNGTEWNVV